MISNEEEPSQKASLDTWEYCKFENEETKSLNQTVVFEDTLLILGTQYLKGISPYIIILDPATQTFKVIELKTDKFHEQHEPSVCYWKDNKFIVFGGEEPFNYSYTSAVLILTLKDLESENPSADLQTIQTSNQMARGEHSAHIYEGKMYVFGGVYDNRFAPQQDFWCLDLSTFTWEQVYFKNWREDQYSHIKFFTVFNENKAYMIPLDEKNDDPQITIQEFDLEKMTCEEIKIPTGPGITHARISPQLIDGKFYCWIATGTTSFDLWTLDLSSKNWARIETKQNPSGMKWNSRLVLCDNQLVQWSENQLWTLPLVKLETQVKPTKSQQNWKDLLLEAPYSDISFEVESEIIKAHKWVLAKNCKYFANMFASGMSEAQASTIKITDMNAPTFKALLEFLYSDHVELNSTLALELLKQADKYSILELQKECETFLSKNIDPENFMLIAQTAELLEAETLREAITAYITKNIKKLKKRTDLNLNALSEGFLRDSIVKIDAN